MIIKSFSKINLTLKVNSKTKNGLHEIQSLYTWINLYDIIKINKIKKNKDKIIFKGTFSNSVNNRNNTVHNLLKILRKLNLISNYYSIIVTKNIPAFGGLGGGTSNAAFLLKFLLKKKINKTLFNKLQSTIGSDLNLFFAKQGFLKDIRSVINLKKKQLLYFVLVQPKVKCSTKEIFSIVNKFSSREKFDKNLEKSRNKFLEYLSNNRNDLQFIVERKYPIIKKLLMDIEKEKGCRFSRITGSGSVCYGLFKDQFYAKKALNNLKKKYPKFWFSFAKTV